jgi:hypothetical protein
VAQRLTPLSFRRTDSKPPGSVQHGERAEHDKENGFAHLWIKIAQATPTTRSNDAAR